MFGHPKQTWSRDARYTPEDEFSNTRKGMRFFWRVIKFVDNHLGILNVEPKETGKDA
jgi:hypothetical protein